MYLYDSLDGRGKMCFERFTGWFIDGAGKRISWLGLLYEELVGIWQRSDFEVATLYVRYDGRTLRRNARRASILPHVAFHTPLL